MGTTADCSVQRAVVTSTPSWRSFPGSSRSFGTSPLALITFACSNYDIFLAATGPCQFASLRLSLARSARLSIAWSRARTNLPSLPLSPLPLSTWAPVRSWRALLGALIATWFPQRQRDGWKVPLSVRGFEFRSTLIYYSMVEYSAHLNKQRLICSAGSMIHRSDDGHLGRRVRESGRCQSFLGGRIWCIVYLHVCMPFN